MKRTERRHLKENPLADVVAGARQAVEQRRGPVVTIAAAVAVVLVAVLGYLAWQSRTESRSQALLAEALVTETAVVGPPPAEGEPRPALRFDTDRQRDEAALTRFRALADEFPSTDAGVFARYRAATLHMKLGQHAEALSAFQQVADNPRAGIYGQMARLGLAEAQARAGQLEQAISTYKDLAGRADSTLPLDGILMQLGRAYLEAGKTADAKETFDRIVKEFPASPYSAEAQRELDELAKG